MDDGVTGPPERDAPLQSEDREAPPQPEEREPASPPQARGHRIGLSVCLLVAGLFLLWRVGEPFLIGPGDFANAQVAMQARNFLDHGYRSLKFAPIRTVFHEPAEAAGDAYLNWPVGETLFLSLVFQLFGTSAAVTRGVAALCTLLMTGVTYRLLQRRFAPLPASVGTALMIGTPLYYWYGRSMDLVAPNVLGLVVMLNGLALLKERKEGSARGTIWLCAGWAIAAACDWFPYLLLGLVLADGLRPGGPESLSRARKPLLGLAGLAGATFLGHWLHVAYVFGGIAPLWETFTLRTVGYQAGHAMTPRSVDWGVFFRAEWNHLLDLFAPLGAVLLLGFGVSSLFPGGRARWGRPIGYLCLTQVAFLLLFRNGAIIHGSYLSYSLPVLAWAGAALMEGMGKLVRPGVTALLAGGLLSLGLSYTSLDMRAHLERQEWEPTLMAQLTHRLGGPRDRVITNGWVVPTVQYYVNRPLTVVKSYDEAIRSVESGEYAYFLFLSLRDQFDAPEVLEYLREHHRFIARMGYYHLFQLHPETSQPPLIEIRYRKPTWAWWFFGSPVRPPYTLERRAPAAAPPPSPASGRDG